VLLVCFCDINDEKIEILSARIRELGKKNGKEQRQIDELQKRSSMIK
jgi:hypothetical protein